MRLIGATSGGGIVDVLVVVVVVFAIIAVLVAVGMILDGRSARRPVGSRFRRLRSRRPPPP